VKSKELVACLVSEKKDKKKINLSRTQCIAGCQMDAQKQNSL
jgi:hypothetical protein